MLRSLDDEKESIIFEAINDTIKSFDETKGTFKALFSNITMHITCSCISKFNHDPLSDYISLDDDRKIGDEMIFMDSIITNNNEDKVRIFDETQLKVIKKHYKGHYQRRIQRMIEMKRDGFSYKEIGMRYQMSDKAVRAIFYRLKIRLNKERKPK